MVRLALSAPPRSLFGARAAVTRATLPRCAVADDDDDDGDELVGGETLNLRGRSVSKLFLDERSHSRHKRAHLTVHDPYKCACSKFLRTFS